MPEEVQQYDVRYRLLKYQPSEDQLDSRIDVLFDSENCIFDGATTIQAGETIISLENQSDFSAQLLVYAHMDGYAWQDVLDFYGEPGSTGGWPEFYIDVKSTVVVDEPHARKFYIEPGFYSVIALVTIEGPPRIYPCTLLDVREAP